MTKNASFAGVFCSHTPLYAKLLFSKKNRQIMKPIFSKLLFILFGLILFTNIYAATCPPVIDLTATNNGDGTVTLRWTNPPQNTWPADCEGNLLFQIFDGDVNIGYSDKDYLTSYTTGVLAAGTHVLGVQVSFWKDFDTNICYAETITTTVDISIEDTCPSIYDLEATDNQNGTATLHWTNPPPHTWPADYEGTVTTFFRFYDNGTEIGTNDTHNLRLWTTPVLTPGTHTLSVELIYRKSQNVEICSAEIITTTVNITTGGGGTDGNVVVILEAHNVWNDGSGYQLLLDADATTYGSTIPEKGALADCDAPATLYDVFEHKIPTNADPSCTTTHVVFDGKETITIPAGIYDFCVVNPSSGNRLWIAGGEYGRKNDFVFLANNTYHFQVAMGNNGDEVSLANTSSISDAAAAKICVYPNPVAEVLYIVCDNLKGIRLFNQTAQIVLESNIENKINVSGLPDGIYFLEITSQNNARRIEKIIISK